MNRNLSILFFMLIHSCQVNAIVINEEVFKENGGDIDNIQQSIKYANNQLREVSYSKKYLSEGKISGCTATWIGDDDDQRNSYILTAAHCIDYKGEKTPVNKTFWSWDDKAVAKGNGFAFVLKNRAAGRKRASTDIAILMLPKVGVILDKNGTPLQKPIIYDGNDESYHIVNYVGYGEWGVGSDTRAAYKPSNGASRLWGQSVVENTGYLSFLSTSYEPTGQTERWAIPSYGDSGSAWWQDVKGKNVIIGDLSRSGIEKGIRSSFKSTAARVSKYKNWIKSIYSGARFLSKEFLDWGNNDQKGSIGDLYQYDNLSSGDTELFRLIGLDEDGTYGNFPTYKGDNEYWTYIGPYKWIVDGKGKVGGIFQNLNHGIMELFTLTEPNLDGTYGGFPAGRGNNENWTFLKTVFDANYAPVYVEFAMVTCGIGKNYRRCGKARVTIDPKSYIRLGSPVSGQYSYSKKHTFAAFTAVFKPVDAGQEYRVVQTDANEKTPSKGGYYFTLDKVCFSDYQGNKISCAESDITGDPDSDELKNATLTFLVSKPDGSEKNVPVIVGIRTDKFSKHIYLHVNITMKEQTYAELNSPETSSFQYHSSKDSAPISVDFVSGKSAYQFEKTDKANTVLATDNYSFTLDRVCLKDDNDLVGNRCVKADDLTDGSYLEGYQKQILNFPIPIVSENIYQ